MADELNAKLEMPGQVVSAFRGDPKPLRVRLDPQFRLYRFTDSALMSPISAWWAPVDQYHDDPGLEARLGLARRLGANPAELMRVVGAVNESWGNKMSNLLKAELLKPVWGFWGQCSMQSRNNAGSGITKNLPGYAWQLYIPNLTAAEIRQTSMTPAVR
jgi:hypothetical protein